MPKLVDEPWVPADAEFGVRRARLSFTYQAYVPDPIADLDVPLSSEATQLLTEANRRIVLLKADPPAFGAFEVLARQLLRSESVASSRIEGLALSHRRLARAAFGGGRADLTAAAVLGNVRAMERAEVLATKPRFGVSELRALHRALFDDTPDRRLAGVVRDGPSWLGGSASSPRGAEFVPPPADRIAALLDDLSEFLARDDLPALVQAAIAHAQFETIHPFIDGNGRAGRCLIHVVLRRRGLTPRYVPPVSLVLARDARAYIAGLTAYRRGDVAGWCAHFCAAAGAAADAAAAYATDLAALRNQWLERAGHPRAGSTARALLDALPGTPVLDVATAERLAQTSNQAARLAVLALEAAGILHRINTGARNRAWEAPEVFDLIERVEARVERGVPAPRARRATRGRTDARTSSRAKRSRG